MKSLLCSVCVCLTLLFAAAACNAAESGKKEAAKPINKKCPVEGGDVDSAVTVEHEGKTIGFCCAGCDTEFKKDPAKYMAIVAKEQKDAKKADAGKKEEAKLNTKCPDSDDEITDATLTKEYKGRTIAFCCDGCIKDFDKDPKKYVAKHEAAEKAEKAKKKDEGKAKK